MQAKLFFEWLIFPMPLEEFYDKYWEKRPLAIKRKLPKFYDGWSVAWLLASLHGCLSVC